MQTDDIRKFSLLTLKKRIVLKILFEKILNTCSMTIILVQQNRHNHVIADVHYPVEDVLLDFELILLDL